MTIKEHFCDERKNISELNDTVWINQDAHTGLWWIIIINEKALDLHIQIIHCPYCGVKL